VKKTNKITIQFVEVIKHSGWDRCTWFLHISSICRLIQDNEGNSWHFSKGISFWTWRYQFWECLVTQICCAKEQEFM